MSSETSLPGGANGAGGRMVLLIEDDAIHAAIIEEIIRPLCTTVLRATDLNAARAILGERWVDMIIADLFLPDSMPTASLSALVELADEIPIVVVTAWTFPLAMHLMYDGARLRLFDKRHFDAGAFRVLVDYLLASGGAGTQGNPFLGQA